VGDLLTTEGHGITSVHMGLTLIRVSLFQRLIDAGLVDAEPDGDEPFFKTVKEIDGRGRTRQGTEDIYMCQKAMKIGAKILVDTSCLAGHIDKNQGVIWGLHPDCPPVKRAKWLGRKDQAEASGNGDGNGEPHKIALDLGAGGRRREWTGHKTYTLDIRPEAKPDYCQDTRLLNFPNDHWDLVASSHHLEHIGRWDQEAVWSEMYRVTKPGGRFEHIVPSLDWAARKVSEGETDEHTYNVLYGAQEAHGYGRTLNAHYFGYTKRIAAALAEAAGYVDVTCEDWSDNPENGYNLVVKGRKPEAVDNLECRELDKAVDDLECRELVTV
jgi:SAM-dependent methyltransferase